MMKLSAMALAAAFVAGAAGAENVEIHAVDMLDNIQNGYCLDIAKGQGADANPEDGLQAHTCYSPSGRIFVDQAFAPEKFDDGLLYMPEFDVCVQAISPSEGASVTLAACDGSDSQEWTFTGEGTISPKTAPDLCLTMGEETRTGRSPENQMKTLTLETCSADAAPSQVWAVRTAN